MSKNRPTEQNTAFAMSSDRYPFMSISKCCLTIKIAFYESCKLSPISYYELLNILTLMQMCDRVDYGLDYGQTTAWEDYGGVLQWGTTALPFIISIDKSAFVIYTKN